MEKDTPSVPVNSQLWTYNDGFFINELSGYVLEATSSEFQWPRNVPLCQANFFFTVNGEVNPGTDLIVDAQRADGDNANQKWRRSNDRYICEANTDVCIWGPGGNVRPDIPAVVDTIQGDQDTQKWTLESVRS